MMQRYWCLMPVSDHIIVFDLDDTLYKERDYVLSGVAAVIKSCCVIGLIDPAVANAPFTPDVDVGNFIDALCAHLSLPSTFKTSLLWMYRLHEPAIALDKPTKAALQLIRSKAKATAIITDGRGITQRLKIKALGLSDIPAFVSEEHENGKPAPDMFLAVVKRWPGCKYTYVGDNTSKDFVSPNALGWFTVGLRNNGRNIHPQSRDGEQQFQPAEWIETFAELPEIVFRGPILRETSH
jgi:putative hydrolase of the HAD superfamily